MAKSKNKPKTKKVLDEEEEIQEEAAPEEEAEAIDEEAAEAVDDDADAEDADADEPLADDDEPAGGHPNRRSRPVPGGSESSQAGLVEPALQRHQVHRQEGSGRD